MSPEFAGAMVTVIPLVMLMCVVEAKALYAYWDDKADGLVAEIEDARVAAGAAAVGPSSVNWRLRWMLHNPSKLLPWLVSVYGTIYWFLMAAAHFVSEAGLILWLASSRPSGMQYLDELVVGTAIWGFGHATLLATFIVVMRVPLRLYRAVGERSTVTGTSTP